MRAWLLSLLLLAVSADHFAAAGTVNLWGNADGDTTYIEEFSDGFIRVDLYEPPPQQTQQRFHSIEDPSVTYGNPGYDGFPNDERFRMGSVEYDDSTLVNGSGAATITTLNFGIDFDPNDPTYFNYYRWITTETIVDSFAGTVTVVGGQPTAINLTSSVRLRVRFSPTISFDALGNFSITGDRFDGMVTYLFAGQHDMTWDFAGTLTSLATAQPGDFDGDGDVDGRDFLLWQRGESPNEFSNGDLQDWQTHYGAGSVMTVSVPEPGAVALLVVTASIMINRRGNKV